MTEADRLDDLARRIDRLVTDPDAVTAPWTRLVRPLLRRLGWQPRVRVAEIQSLLALLREKVPGRDVDASEALAKGVEAATRELEENVLAVERACVVNRRPQVAHAAWLRRLHEVLARASRAVARLDDAAGLRVAAAIDPVQLLPPLAIRARPEAGAGADAAGADADAAGERASDPGAAYDPALAPRAPPSPVDPARLLELQLNAVDHLIHAARREPDVLARRRRLLEAARQVLLEVSAAMPLEDSGVEARRAYIAREITRIDRLEAAGVATEVGLVHQARGALARGDRQKLHAALVAIDRAALDRGDARVAALAGEALARLWKGEDPRDPKAVRASLARSAAECFGADVVLAVGSAYAEGRAKIPADTDALTFDERNAREQALAYLAPGSDAGTLSAAVAVDGCFEVGGVLAPVRVHEHELRVSAVRFPTQDLVIMQARDVDDVPDAIIQDPRSVVLDLAAGRLLARRYVREEVHTRRRTIYRGEVRVYVVDGSGSMIGPRARMRDAILVAELATLMKRLSTGGRDTRVVLFYRYFNDAVGPTTRVDSIPSAQAAIADVLSNVRRGGTDIEAALVASFAQIRDARANDPDLARAQVVLVTDGEAPVREELVERAREGVGDLPVGVSVIALGQENAALRALVARQRARGERAFYHFIDDGALEAMAHGELDDGPALHLPPALSGEGAAPAEQARELEGQVGGLLDELATLDRARDVEALEALEHEARALREVGLAPESALTEGERARVEALHRDRRALERRYARWFPVPAAAGSPRASLPSAETVARDDLDAALVALATVAEVVAVVGGSELARMSDAIEVLERLLPDARLSPARYADVLAAHGPHVAAALEAVHRAVRRPAATPSPAPPSPAARRG